MRFIDTVKCFNGQEFEFQQYTAAVDRAASWYIGQARSTALQIGFVRLVILSMFFQGFYYGSHMVELGKKDPGQILTTFWACLMAAQTFEQILPQRLVLERGRAAASTLLSVLTKLEKGRKLIEVHDGRTPLYLDGDIRLQDVCSPVLCSGSANFDQYRCRFLIRLGEIDLRYPMPHSSSLPGKQLLSLEEVGRAKAQSRILSCSSTIRRLESSP